MLVTTPSPARLEDTMSGPKIASKSTASHITTIARDAPISGTRSCNDQRCLSWSTPDGSRGIVAVSPPSVESSIALDTVREGIGDRPDHRWGICNYG